jgi:hypothetical protein
LKSGTTYILDLLFEVVSIIAVLHEQYYFLFILRVIIELDYVFVFELRMDHTLLTSISHLYLIYQLVFVYALLNDPLTALRPIASYQVGLFVRSQGDHSGRKLDFVDFLDD